jgi:hypothetical protein
MEKEAYIKFLVEGEDADGEEFYVIRNNTEFCLLRSLTL